MRPGVGGRVEGKGRPGSCHVSASPSPRGWPRPLWPSLGTCCTSGVLKQLRLFFFQDFFQTKDVTFVGRPFPLEVCAALIPLSKRSGMELYTYQGEGREWHRKHHNEVKWYELYKPVFVCENNAPKCFFKKSLKMKKTNFVYFSFSTAFSN